MLATDLWPRRDHIQPHRARNESTSNLNGISYRLHLEFTMNSHRRHLEVTFYEFAMESNGTHIWLTANSHPLTSGSQRSHIKHGSNLQRTHTESISNIEIKSKSHCDGN